MDKIDVHIWMIAQSLVVTDKSGAIDRAIKERSRKGLDLEDVLLWDRVIDAVKIIQEKNKSDILH